MAKGIGACATGFSGFSSTRTIRGPVSMNWASDLELVAFRARPWISAPLDEVYFADCELLHTDPVRRWTSDSVQAPGRSALPADADFQTNIVIKDLQHEDAHHRFGRQRRNVGVVVAALLTAGAVAGWTASATFATIISPIEDLPAFETTGKGDVKKLPLDEFKLGLIGSYVVTGTEPGGEPYVGAGVLDIALAPSGALELIWDNGKHVGVGQVIGNVLAVASSTRGRNVILMMKSIRMVRSPASPRDARTGVPKAPRFGIGLKPGMTPATINPSK